MRANKFILMIRLTYNLLSPLFPKNKERAGFLAVIDVIFDKLFDNNRSPSSFLCESLNGLEVTHAKI